MFLQVCVCPWGGAIPACLAAGGAIPACIAGGIPACLAARGVLLLGDLLRGGGLLLWPSVMVFCYGLLIWCLLLKVAFWYGLLGWPEGHNRRSPHQKAPHQKATTNRRTTTEGTTPEGHHNRRHHTRRP